MRKAIIGVILMGIIAAGCAEETVIAGIVRSPLPDVGAVTLPDIASGTPLTMKAEPGGLLLVYFGYTSCPDVCPTTLAEIRSALADMGDDAERVQVAMATVDPIRDTDEVMIGYLHSFIPDGHPLRTEDDGELLLAANALGAAYSVVENDEGEIEVAHTGHLYAIDDQGLLQITWPFGIQSDDIRSDIRILLNG
ncbi:SCO family protein [bacterium]|nr:SCO family protein [bacterium]